MKLVRISLLCASFSILFAACGGHSDNSASDSAPIVDRNPIQVETPTPTPPPVATPTPTPPGSTPTPSPSPSPSATPGSSPSPSPTASPSPSNPAQNISESVSNIRWADSSSGTSISVNYADLDHAGAEKSVQFNVRFSFPMPPYIRYALNSSDSSFNGSTIECSYGCAIGAINIVHAGGSSRMNGNVTVHFFRKQLSSLYRSINGGGADGSVEAAVIRSLSRSNLLSGSVTAFSVQNGRSQPFWIDLIFSQNPRSGSPIEVVSVSGNNISNDAAVSLQYQRVSQSPVVQSLRASTMSDGNGYVDLCFKNTSGLKRLSAYTWQSANSMSFCE